MQSATFGALENTRRLLKDLVGWSGPDIALVLLVKLLLPGNIQHQSFQHSKIGFHFDVHLALVMGCSLRGGEGSCDSCDI